MAKPIEPTPVLENKDAKAFWDSLENTKFDSKKETYLEQSKAVFKHFNCRHLYPVKGENPRGAAARLFMLRISGPGECQVCNPEQGSIAKRHYLQPDPGNVGVSFL